MKTLNTIMSGVVLNVAIERDNSEGGLFTSMFSNVTTNKLTERVNSLFKLKAPDKLRQATAALNTWSYDKPYMVIKGMDVYRPPRMSVTYVEYIQALSDALTAMNFIERDLLKPLFLIIGALINDPATVLNKAMSLNKLARIPLLDNKIDGYVNAIANSLKDASNSDTMKFGEAFANNTQLTEANNACAALNKLAADFKADSVSKRVEELFGLANTLSDQVKLLGNAETIKKLPVINELANALFISARWIELAGLSIHGNLMVTTALNDTNDKLLKQTKK